MSVSESDRLMLKEFETGLDPLHPDKGGIPARVIGYGEISTVMEIGAKGGSNLAYKRVPIFRDQGEIEAYEALYRDYIHTLQDRIGIQVVPSDITSVTDEPRHRDVAYIIQEKLPKESIGQKAIHALPAEEVNRLILAILAELSKVFDFNQKNLGKLELGIDGQISNWAITDFDPDIAKLKDPIKLVYFDTSTPLLRREGKEQLDPELFLRGAPSFLVWLLRWLFLEDVMTRYYDFRKVSIDLIANFYKEQRPELIPGLVEVVNGFLAERIDQGVIKPLSTEEVKTYYREDAMIWRLYLSFRKVDRTLHQLLGRYYPYILPGRIRR